MHDGARNMDRAGVSNSVGGNSKSYASILKRDQAAPKGVVEVKDMETSIPDVVIPILPNDMISIPDSATIVLGKVKNLSIIENLSALIMKEGFRNVDITYVGGSWVWIEFDNRNACTRFKHREDLLKLFHIIQNVSRQFVVDDKIVWVEISGMPLGAWGKEAFKKVASVWGEVVFMDNSERAGICNGRVCLRVDSRKIIQGRSMITLDGLKHEVRVKELGTWLPIVATTVDDSEEGSEADRSMECEDDEQGDSNSSAMDKNEDAYVSMEAMEDGEIRPDEGTNKNTHQDGVLDDNVSEANDEHATNSNRRWADEVELGDAVMQEVAAVLPRHNQAVETVPAEGEAASTDTPSRPPGFSASVLRHEVVQDGSRCSSAPAAGGTKKWKKKASSMSLGSQGNVLIELLNGMNFGTTPETVVENMQKFIEIGVKLGYDMEACEETRKTLLSRIGGSTGF